MCEATVNISTHLAKIAIWKTRKYHVLLKHMKFYALIIISLSSGYITIQYLFSESVTFIKPHIILLIWMVFVAYEYIRAYYILNKTDLAYSYDVKLSKNGVEVSNEKYPWDHYNFYIEFNNYLEIHGKDEISYLPKTTELQKIVEYTKNHIPKNQMNALARLKAYK